MSESIHSLSSSSRPIIPKPTVDTESKQVGLASVDTVVSKSTVGISQPTLHIESGTTSHAPVTGTGGMLTTDVGQYLNGVLVQFQALQSEIQSTSADLPDLHSPDFANNLSTLSPEEQQTTSRALNNASAYLQLSSAALMADPSHAQKVSIGLSEILQLVNELRRTMGKTYHEDMQGQRTQMMKGYDAKISAMLEAAKNDYAAGLARGIGGVVGGTISVVPIVGGAGQIATGAGDIVAAMKQYEADKARAEQTKFEGVIAGAQNRLEEFGKFYDSLKQWVGDMVSNVQKTIEDSENTKQGIARNI